MFPSREGNLLVWIAIGTALVVWHLVTLARRGELPALADFTSLMTQVRAMRWALLVGWVWLGWHLFVRTEWA